MNKMKRILFLLAIIAIFAVAIATAPAQVAPVNIWGGVGTVGTDLSYAVVTANGRDQAQPVVTFLQAKSDKTASALTFYHASTAIKPIRLSGAGATNLLVSSTNGLAADQVVVIRLNASDRYERGVIHGLVNSTNIALKATINTAADIVAGDLLYVMSAAGTVPVGNTTLTLNGPGLFMGQRGRPLLIDLDGTSACQVQAVTAVFPKLE
jgi:hypothetical protein